MKAIDLQQPDYEDRNDNNTLPPKSDRRVISDPSYINH